MIVVMVVAVVLMMRIHSSAGKFWTTRKGFSSTGQPQRNYFRSLFDVQDVGSRKGRGECQDCTRGQKNRPPTMRNYCELFSEQKLSLAFEAERDWSLAFEAERDSPSNSRHLLLISKHTRVKRLEDRVACHTCAVLCMMQAPSSWTWS